MTASPPAGDPGGQPRLFRSVWRWHFYAGLLSIPVIVLLCLSGIVYLFKPQIDAVAYGSLRNVTAQATSTTYAAQSAAVLKAYPGATISGLAPAPEADRATEFDVITEGGADVRVYVDPYTARVLGDREPSRSFTTLALDLHGTLLTSRFLDTEGKLGDRLIELTASWAVVLVITGMYLWWPRGRRGLRDALRPRLRSTSSRTRWRDLHAVTGVLFGFVTLFFLITGLAWSGVWGAKFNELATKTGELYPAGLYDGAESGTVEDTVKNGKAAWAASALPLQPSAPAHTHDLTASAPTASTPTPSSSATPAGSPGGIPETGGRPGHSGHSGHADQDGASALSQLTVDRPDVTTRSGDDGHTGHSHRGSIRWDPAKGAPIDAIVGRAQELGFPPGFTIAYPEDETGSYTVSRFPDADVAPNARAGQERLAYLDQYTALPLADFGFADFGVLAQATDFGIALHEGRQWGIWSQLFALSGTLALLLSCATAVVMWRKRRPKGIGSPRRPPNRKLGVGVVLITLGLGVVFPLLGLSILALLVFDFVVVRHVPPLARALGAR
ncbi:MAG: PepSY domain-containing protein [Solirubrobacteraceae bacterium]|nr:PepSY domain-containing protein [Solirubrobacteraceae bacterium]